MTSCQSRVTKESATHQLKAAFTSDDIKLFYAMFYAKFITVTGQTSCHSNALLKVLLMMQNS